MKARGGRPEHAEAANSPREMGLDQIADALRDLRYGQVTVIVQDGVIVQIERTEKRRIS